MKNEYPHFKPPQDLGKKLDTMRSGSHTKYNNNYHVVWIPKYRRAVLGNPKIKEILIEIINGQCEDKGWKVFALEVMPDHVHLFISIQPRWSIDKVVKQLKGNTSTQLRRIFPELKARTRKALWAKGYYETTAGYVSQDQIKKYIDKQTEFIHKDRAKRLNPQQNQNVERQRQLTTIPPPNKFGGFLVGT